MTDLLLEVGRSKAARGLIRRLGVRLPIALPPVLERASGPWEEAPLAGMRVLFGGGADADGVDLEPRILESLQSAGAIVNDGETNAEPGRPRNVSPFRAGRSEGTLDSKAPSSRLDGLVFDATTLDSTASLSQLYEFFHSRIPALAPSGRIVILGRPRGAVRSATDAAAQAALGGFCRSLAKEVGRRGATANLVLLEPDSVSRIDPVLRFLLSRRSVFVTGQSIPLDARVPAPAELPRTQVLAGKVALVTGAARGIGEKTARLLAGEGARVVCLDREADQAAGRALARAIGGFFLGVDLTCGGAPSLVAETLSRRHGGVDVVVHNAGITRDRTLGRMQRSQWDEAIDVNLTAVARIDDALSSHLLRDQGRVICLASVAGIAGNFGQTNYAAAKAGLIGYVERRAASLANRGITVNAVAPGFIETRMTEVMPAMIRQAGRRLSALGQGGLPEDVGQVITFLASPGAAAITGSTLRVCGGAFLGA